MGAKEQFAADCNDLLSQTTGDLQSAIRTLCDEAVAGEDQIAQRQGEPLLINGEIFENWLVEQIEARELCPGIDDVADQIEAAWSAVQKARAEEGNRIYWEKRGYLSVYTRNKKGRLKRHNLLIQDGVARLDQSPTPTQLARTQDRQELEGVGPDTGTATVCQTDDGSELLVPDRIGEQVFRSLEI